MYNKVNVKEMKDRMLIFEAFDLKSNYYQKKSGKCRQFNGELIKTWEIVNKFG